jgi:RNA polymerase primary sigma factor
MDSNFWAIGKNISLNYWLHMAAQYSLLSKEEEIEIAQKIERGDESAREKLVLENLDLLYQLLQNIGDIMCLTEDFIQERSIGLSKATQEYDYHRGFRFSTYATWWIWRHIVRAINNNSRLLSFTWSIENEVDSALKAYQQATRIKGSKPCTLFIQRDFLNIC